jgi:hypothetical protein
MHTTDTYKTLGGLGEGCVCLSCVRGLPALVRKLWVGFRT